MTLTDREELLSSLKLLQKNNNRYIEWAKCCCKTFLLQRLLKYKNIRVVLLCGWKQCFASSFHFFFKKAIQEQTMSSRPQPHVSTCKPFSAIISIEHYWVLLVLWVLLSYRGIFAWHAYSFVKLKDKVH